MKRTQYNRIVGAVLALAVRFAGSGRELQQYGDHGSQIAQPDDSAVAGVSGTNTGDILRLDAER